MAETIFSTPIQNGVQKQLDSILAAAATSAVLNADVSALFTSTDATHPCIAVIDRIDSNGNLTPTKREYIKFTGVATTTLTGLTRNADSSGSDQEHAVGAIVEFVPDVLWAKSLMDNYVDASSAQTLAGKTLTTPIIASFYQDAGGTKLMTTPDTASDTLAALAATQTLTNKTLTKPTINAAVHTPAASTPAGAGTTTLDLAANNIFTVTMPAATQTLAISNETAGQCFIVEINNVTSQGALTWFTTIKWAGGTAPTLTGTNGKRDVFGFRVTGTDTYDGFIVGQNL